MLHAIQAIPNRLGPSVGVPDNIPHLSRVRNHLNAPGWSEQDLLASSSYGKYQGIDPANRVIGYPNVLMLIMFAYGVIVTP